MRKLEKKMEQWLDAKLASNGLAQKAIEMKDARTLFRLAAESCVGIKETSNNAGPMVELLQETIDGADREPWCMSFVQTCLAYAEKKTGIKSPIVAGEHCMTVWNESPKSSRVKKFPASGAIIIWKHGNGPAGHTGVMLEFVINKKMSTCEGNTSDSSMREGDAVALKSRSTVATGSMKVVGFLKPF